MELDFSGHAATVLAERQIEQRWVDLVIEAPALVQEPGDVTVHYLARSRREKIECFA